MIDKFIIVDNCFDNPYEIIEFSNQLEFASPKSEDNWYGLRSKELQTFNKIFGKIIYETIVEKLIRPYLGPNIIYNYQSITDLFFHKLSNVDNLTNHKWWHTDSTLYSGVVYLNECAPTNSGTMLQLDVENGICIDNIFNRLIYYRGDIPHRPEIGFTNNNIDRLTLNIFTYAYNIQSKYNGSVAEHGLSHLT